MKRVFDILLSVALFLPCAVVITFLSLLIVIIDRFSPFHFQKRVGRKGKVFICFKLQTMNPPKTMLEVGERENDVLRTTRLGTFIRDHGWDELPQIINVLRGEMSFVGPRPLLPKTLSRIEEKNQEIVNVIKEWKRLRTYVRPGISGWHQIHIGVYTSMVECDLDYLKNPSLLRGIKIFFITAAVFFFGKKLSKILAPA